MNVQVTLTVNEAKWIIAKGVCQLPVVQKAIRSGRIFLKGGTTVSAVCEELAGEPLRISGRITPSGAKTAHDADIGFHCALIEAGKYIGADGCLEKVLEKLSAEDVAFVGANAFDSYGNAALMYGSFLGSAPGRIISGLMAEIKHLIIPVGWEKFIPGSLPDIISRTGRRNIDRSMGMAVGLSPIIGRIVTETDAIRLLADVDCTIIGRGGIDGAEGSTTFVIEGDRKEVLMAFDHILSVKGKGVSGCAPSLKECDPPIAKCGMHRACMYKKGSDRRK